MPRRPSLVKTSESLEPRITSTSAKEEEAQQERSDANKQFGQARRRQLIGSWLVFGMRLFGRINPRFAVAVVSCALFAGLLIRVSHMAQDQAFAPAAPAPQLTAMPPPAKSLKQSDETKQALEIAPAPPVAAVRMIDAPPEISASCHEQAWPYVTGACLTRSDDQIQAETIVPETNQETAADHIVPATLVNAVDAQAKMSPEDSLSVVIDKPRHARSKRRHHDQVQAERRRRAPPRAMASRDVAFGVSAFQPLAASNMP